MTTKLLFTLILIAILTSCGGDEILIPKPPYYLRTDFPKHTYALEEKSSTYQFELAQAYQSKLIDFKGQPTDHQEIDLGPLNGKLYLSYFPVYNRDTLIKYINISNDRVDEHQVKATKIIDKTFIFPEKKVYGTFFELQGNVATNYQFYLTDSTSHFLRGEVLLNCRPNYDSLKPTLNYLKQDLLHLVETLTWK
ncbi:MAG TPA: hypothetical protein PLI97_04705 [Fluviicola sp.]|nr:hypothetical protein [Fluviicola sp.]